MIRLFFSLTISSYNENSSSHQLLSSYDKVDGMGRVDELEGIEKGNCLFLLVIAWFISYCESCWFVMDWFAWTDGGYL